MGWFSGGRGRVHLKPGVSFKRGKPNNTGCSAYNSGPLGARPQQATAATAATGSNPSHSYLFLVLHAALEIPEAERARIIATVARACGLRIVELPEPTPAIHSVVGF